VFQRENYLSTGAIMGVKWTGSAYTLSKETESLSRRGTD
jgi:hypothetical protein